MLKRISKIQGIGAFANCINSASAEFRKTTVVFGYNSRGKSTLTEVFRSIESNDSAQLQARITIPGGKSQAAQLSLTVDGKAESPLIFDGNEWKGTPKDAIKWRVFDSGFISRNVLSNHGVERDQKENFSKFVLGEDGVRKAEAIATKKQEARKLSKDIKQTGEQIKGLAGSLGVDKFVALVIGRPREQINEEHLAAVAALGKIRESKAAVNLINARPEVKSLPRYTSLAQSLDHLDAALKITLEDIHDSARNRLSEHVNKHMAAGQGQRDWIQKGLEFINGEDCPFCEQGLSAPAQDLISQYRAAFNDEFNLRARELQRRLDELDDLIVKHGLPDFAAASESNIKSMQLYPELMGEDEYKTLSETLVQLGGGAVAAANTLREELGKRVDEGRAAIRRKKSSLFEPGALSDFTGLREVEKMFSELLESYDVKVNEINQRLAIFKAGISVEQLASQEAAALVECEKLAMLLRRLDNAVLCQTYSTQLSESKVADKQLLAMQEELESEQSAYLEKFFEKINSYFRVFGSRDFIISKDKETRGDLPVYTLSVKYKNQEVSSNKLGMVFSESDRRALALSIFWASLSVTDAAALSSTIVVLDDPVTSFDDNRISSAIREFREMAQATRQLILLSHYRNFVQHYLDLQDVGGDFCLLLLEKDAATSYLAVGAPSAFLESEHHKKFKNIVDFIDKKKAEPIAGDLRVYLEEELKSRYRRQINTLNIGGCTLSDIIDALHEDGCYSDNIKKKLHFFREDLNSPHHKWESRTPDDWASLAADMLDLVYSEL